MDEAKENTEGRRHILQDFTLDALKASEVEACRICLITDVKMYSLQGTNLGTCMESIGGFTKSYDGLPNYVCYECAPILVKCNKLIQKSKVAQATLLDIFTKNGQINKPLIKEQNKSQNLQSSLDSYLLINYFYIKYDDDNCTSDFIKIESEPNQKINIKLKNEIKDESSDEISDSEILNMIKSLSEKEEKHSEDEVEVIEADVPMVEIMSDDEKIGDDFISLKTYDIRVDTRPNRSQFSDYDVPHYRRPRVKGVALAKKVKKKKKKKIKRTGPPETLSSVHLDENYVKKFFNVTIIPPEKTDIVNYSCKFCPETFKYAEDAKDHSIIGCQRPQRSNCDSSAIAIPGPALNSANSNQPQTWKEWPGNT